MMRRPSSDRRNWRGVTRQEQESQPVLPFEGTVHHYPVSPTAPNLIDVSASNTPAVCDPTNPVITSFEGGYPTAYYRAVAEVDAGGKISITDGNAYSGDNGRAVMKGGNGFYYMAGNDNSGNLPKSALCYAVTPQTASSCTLIGTQLVNSTGVELLVPGAVPPVPSNIAMIGRLQFGKDKPGKDTNFRGLTIFNNTLYVARAVAATESTPCI